MSTSCRHCASPDHETIDCRPSVNEEIEPTGDGARSKRQDWRTLRKLDVEIAQRVFAWTPCYKDPHPTDNRAIEGVLYCPPGYPFDSRGALNVVKCYSTDIAAAMEVVEKMRERKLHIVISDNAEREAWDVKMWRGDFDEIANARSDSLPEAICLAALSAVDSQRETNELL
jgi:hypothetical protein